MAFEGPPTRDFSNVVSLNTALLDLIVADPAAIPMPVWLAGRLSALNPAGRRRLARAPMLLLSVGESDIGRWAPVFEGRPNRDLLATLEGRELEGGERRIPHDRYQWPLFLAILCMLFEVGLRERRVKPKEVFA